ncbi:hypothetical protein RvY_17240 [Ramazzottius varieornatus]|uniref:Uncharacterized protein n=1 Tax=Ramazzottius varieornatus TaxID=947166 RepID=A0A1D1W3R8_RAMVA|nr:hypothetical protein RvY_17240 [Ramazzottius varieornatus]
MYRWTPRQLPTVSLPVRATYKPSDSAIGKTLAEHTLLVAVHPMISPEMFKTFFDLSLSDYPFGLVMEDFIVANQGAFEPSIEQRDCVKAPLDIPTTSFPAYVMAGDVAMIMDHRIDEVVVNVVLKPAFRPPGWRVIGRIMVAFELELMKGLELIHVENRDEITVTCNRS